MVFIHCCLCKLTKYDVKLFAFPRNDSLREIWINMLSPHCPEIPKMTRAQLLNRKVCIRHFEKKYLKDNNRVYNSCPTLLTNEEIMSGIPKNPVFVEEKPDYINADHNYHLRLISSPQVDLPPNFTHGEGLSRTGDNLQQPIGASGSIVDPVSNLQMPSCLTSKDIRSQQSVPKRVLEDDFCNDAQKRLKIVEVPSCQSRITQKTKYRLVTSVKTLTPKCRKLYESCKKIIKARRQLFHTPKNIKQAEKHISKYKLLQAYEKLRPMQQKFIDMQLKALHKKKTAKRYTLEEKLLCIALYKQSPKGYTLLHKLFSLPHKRTLNRVLQNVNIVSGINKEFFNALKVKIENWNSTKRLCSIGFDEVQLTPHINYAAFTDRIHGFLNTEDIKFADHALVFLIRGVVASWRQPVAFYFCEGTMPSNHLKIIIKEVTTAVLETGLEPLALICDQGVTFQKALKDMQEETRRQQLINNLPCDDTILIENANFSIIFDPPHLLKGIRNNFLTKNILFEGKVAKWDDIIEVYKNDCAIGNIRTLPKITDEHVIPEKIKKMKVSNCAKVLSTTMAATLRYTASFATRVDGERISPTLNNTADVLQFFDELFDSCNGSRGGRAPGKMRGPVKESSRHSEFWKTALKKLKEMKYLHKKGAETIAKSVPTLKNWVITIKSMLRLKDILHEKGIKFYYTRNLNQDPLENFFGKIRSYNFRNINPDTYNFETAFKSLCMTNILSVHSRHSNCEDDVGSTIINLKNLLVKEPYSNAESLDFNIDIPGMENIIQAPTTAARLSAARGEKISTHARGYTAGYIARRIKKKLNCKTCHKSLATHDIHNVHDLIKFRERQSLKNKNLFYPTTNFIVAFSKLVDCTNNYLNNNCHRANIRKTIKYIFCKDNSLEFLGCPEHYKEITKYFIDFTVKLQIHNWCGSVNKILNGSVQKKLGINMPFVYKLAQQKFFKFRRPKNSP